jgi:copper resistance protein C
MQTYKNSFMKIALSHRWILSCALFLIFQLNASAHAFLDHSEPSVGSVIHAAPDKVKIWFTQNIEPAFSKLRVDDAQGNEVDKKDARVDSETKSLFTVSLPQLPPGTYTVTWTVISVDTHKTQGHFQFTVKPPN